MAADWISAIRPRKSTVLDAAAFLAAVGDGIEDTANAMIKDFERTTATWERQPVFQIMGKASRVGSRVVSVTVGTDDEIYGYVSNGTKPHLIRPKNGTILRFQTGYTAKTAPGRFLSTAGGASGAFAFAKEVHHPGSKPRRFNELIARKYQANGALAKNVQARINAVAAKGAN